jgi:hypothetical protein
MEIIMENTEKELQELLINRVRKEKRSYILSLSIIIIPIIIGVIWWIFSTDKVQELQKQKSGLEIQIKSLESKVNELTLIQNDILEFLKILTSRERIGLIDPDVDWDRTKERIMTLPPGKRKQAVFVAILLAWHELPYEVNQESLTSGFDSPRFLRFILSQVGVKINDEPGIRLSDNLMKKLKKIDDPLPGDLMFYRGYDGNFGFIYLSNGKPNGQGVGVGTLQRIEPLRILDTSNIKTPLYPFIGYFRVNYPDEQ